MPRPITSSQKPVHNTPNWKPPPNRWTISTRRRWAGDGTINPGHSGQLSWAVVLLLRPPRLCCCGLDRCLVVSQNFAGASFRHTQHSYHFSLRIALSRQSNNMQQYWLLQIAWCPQRMIGMQNDLARNTGSIEPSICLTNFTQSGSNMGDIHSRQSQRWNVGTDWHSPLS